MSKAVVMGNGESRSWYNPNTKWADVRHGDAMLFTVTQHQTILFL